ncbi:MAG: hypothetical protein KAY55_02990 [Deltaproteobacteria bacterium]|jgi:hypothetical protein|nr:hypothetical protein [Deltaproteobacteria bacterium]
MARLRDISDDTRVIDLTVADLLELLTDRLGLGPVRREQGVREPEGLLDTWQTAKLLGIFPRQELPPEPPAGTPEYRAWRRKEQSLRNQVARRFQTWLERHPEVAQLAVKPKGERRRYFRRIDIEGYLGRVAVPMSRRRSG